MAINVTSKVLNIDQARQIIEELNLKLVQYQSAYEQVKHQLDELLRYRFGKKSERFVEDINQQDLFSKDKQVDIELTAEAEITVPTHTRRRKKKDLSNYPRIIEVIPVPDQDRRCTCGCEKKVIRYETKELYDYQPAVFQIIEQRREVVACPKGCDCSIITAPLPACVLPKVKATSRLLSHVVVSKCLHRQPLYHLEKYTRLHAISRETLARWFIALTEPLMPIMNLLRDQVNAYDIASLDATSLQVLKEPGRLASTKSYVYCIRGGPPKQSVILYDYAYQHHSEFVDNLFEVFSGVIHMDADNCFRRLTSRETVSAAYCNAHARRKFEAVTKRVKTQGAAHQARYQLRQEKSKPIMDSFKAWLDDQTPRTLPQSPLGKAFAYCQTYWHGLTRFLTDGRLEIDNNHTEREIKPLVMARKNFLFCVSMQGAHALCLHMSLVRTALLHSLEPERYYTYLLNHAPLCQTLEDYERLLPWHLTKPSLGLNNQSAT